MARQQKSRWRWTGALLVALVALSGAGLAWRRSAQSACEGAQLQLEGAWDKPRREAIRLAFLATRKPYAQASWQWADKGLEQYTHAWAEAYRDTCVAARGWHPQPEAVLAPRRRCLEQRRQEVRALAEVLTQVNGPSLAQAGQLLDRLAPLESCVDPSALALWKQLPDEPAVRARLETLLGKLAQVHALYIAGNTTEGLAQASLLAATAEDSGFRPLMAEAFLVLSRLQYAASDAAGAVESAHRSARAFLAGGQLEGVAQAWLALVTALQFQGQQTAPEQERWLQYLEESIIAAGNPPSLRAESEVKLAYIRTSQGRYAQGLEHARKAEALQVQLHPSDSPGLANARVEQLRAGVLLGQYEQAMAAGQQALSFWKNQVGLEHPSTLRVLNLMGVLQAKTWHLEESSATYEQMLAVLRRMPDADYIEQVAVLNNLAVTYIEQGRHSEGEPLLEQALALLDEHHERDSLHGAICLQSLAESKCMRGENAEALQLARQALVLAEKKVSPQHTVLAEILIVLGDAELAAGNASRARPALERALQVLEAGPSHVKERGHARFALARALHAQAVEPSRVLALLSESWEDLEEAGAPAGRLRTAWSAWVKAQQLQVPSLRAQSP